MPVSRFLTISTHPWTKAMLTRVAESTHKLTVHPQRKDVREGVVRVGWP